MPQEKSTEKVRTFDRLWLRGKGQATEGEIMLKRTLILLALALSQWGCDINYGRTSILWISGTWKRSVSGWSERSENF